MMHKYQLILLYKFYSLMSLFRKILNLEEQLLQVLQVKNKIYLVDSGANLLVYNYQNKLI